MPPSIYLLLCNLCSLCSLQHLCAGNEVEGPLVGRIRGMGPLPCAGYSAHSWVLVVMVKSWASHGQVTDKSWASLLSGSSICASSHSKLILRRSWRGGVCSWRHRSWEKKGSSLFASGKRPFLQMTLATCQSLSLLWLFCSSKSLFLLPPFLRFPLGLILAESWGKPSSQQQVSLCSPKPWPSFSSCWHEFSCCWQHSYSEIGWTSLPARHHRFLRK